MKTLLNELRLATRSCRSYLYAMFVEMRLIANLKQKEHPLPNDLIITLTSYPPRFPTLHLTLKCLLTQSIKPNKVILWLSTEDVPLVPNSVLRLREKGLEIRTCEDIGPYKKLVPALRDLPEAFLVTADDDLYYRRDWLEQLVFHWDGLPKQVVVHRAFIFGQTPESLRKPRKTWAPLTTPKQDVYMYPTGGSGILYPPHALSPEATEAALFLKLSPRADDIWFFWMARRGGCSFKKTPLNIKLIYWPNTQESALHHENDGARANDEKTKKMLEHFGPPYP